MKKSLTTILSSFVLLSTSCTFLHPYGEYNLKDVQATRYSLSVNKKTTEKGTYYSFRSTDNKEIMGLYDLDSNSTLDRVEKSTTEDLKRYEVPKGSREFNFWKKEFRKIKGDAKPFQFPKSIKPKHKNTLSRIV